MPLKLQSYEGHPYVVVSLGPRITKPIRLHKFIRDNLKNNCTLEHGVNVSSVFTELFCERMMTHGPLNMNSLSIQFNLTLTDSEVSNEVMITADKRAYFSKITFDRLTIENEMGENILINTVEKQADRCFREITIPLSRLWINKKDIFLMLYTHLHTHATHHKCLN